MGASQVLCAVCVTLCVHRFYCFQLGVALRIHASLVGAVSQRICFGLRICSAGIYSLADLFWISRKSTNLFRMHRWATVDDSLTQVQPASKYMFHFNNWSFFDGPKRGIATSYASARAQSDMRICIRCGRGSNSL